MGENWVKVRNAAARRHASRQRPRGRARSPSGGTSSWTTCASASARTWAARCDPCGRASRPPRCAAGRAVKRLADSGTLEASLRVPDAVGPLTVAGRSTHAARSARASPSTPRRRAGRTTRVNWMLRQLRHAPDDLRIDVASRTRARRPRCCSARRATIRSGCCRRATRSASHEPSRSRSRGHGHQAREGREVLRAETRQQAWTSTAASFRTCVRGSHRLRSFRRSQRRARYARGRAAAVQRGRRAGAGGGDRPSLHGKQDWQER